MKINMNAKRENQMKIEDFPKAEIIGLKAKVTGSKNKDLIGITGKIIDETKKTLTIESGTKKIMIIKNDSKLEIETRNGVTIEIEGDLLYGRPEERIKKKLPKKWDLIKK